MHGMALAWAYMYTDCMGCVGWMGVLHLHTGIDIKISTSPHTLNSPSLPASAGSLQGLSLRDSQDGSPSL